MERSEHVAEWVRLTEHRIGATCTNSSKPGPKGAAREAERSLGLEHTAVSRAIKIAGITDGAKAAAKAAGLEDNQSALLEVAKADPEEQANKVAELQRRREAREILKKSGDAIVKHDGNDEAAQIIIDYIPDEVRQGLLLHLDAAGHHKLRQSRQLRRFGPAEG